jgi:hypothetical protein
LLNATIRKITDILGDFKPEEWVEASNWGPGSTTLITGDVVSSSNKFQYETGITRDLYSLVSPWFYTAYPLWAETITRESEVGGLTFEVGNKIVTVPKNAKTDRVIAIEPGLNLWFQKGIGEMIRKRLRHWGVDLTDQRRNQLLTREGSFDSLLASVDFSSASDTISRELVRELLPPDWFQVMDACRSKFGRMNDGSMIHWEKFSSMGNGFTFELESLIFFASALAVREYESLGSSANLGTISVYGDDVVIPSSIYSSFVEFSAFLGFSVNTKKSYSSSYFRESCGAHWFNGTDVTPIYLKKRLSNVETFYKLANSIRRYAHRRNYYCGCDRRFLPAHRHLLKRVPKPLRFVIPDGYGDVGFIGNFDESASPAARGGIEGYLPRSLVSIGVTQYFDATGLLLSRLRVPSVSESGNNDTLRGRVKRKVISLLVPRWYDLGPWY